MRRWTIRSKHIATLSLAALLAGSGCGYNDLQGLDEEVKGAWAEVQNQYQRRADLIPNLVATVKGSANFEQETLQKVIEARSAATSIKLDAQALSDPAMFKKYEDAQRNLSSSLSRLLVVAEQYPDLKLILAHLGGLLPFYELNSHTKKIMQNVYYDTAATPLLYAPTVYKLMVEVVGPQKILYGSDYPLLIYPRRTRQPEFLNLLAEIRASGLKEGDLALILGENMRQLLL